MLPPQAGPKRTQPQAPPRPPRRGDGTVLPHHAHAARPHHTVALLAAGAVFLTLSGYAAQGRLPGAARGAGWGFLVLGLLAALPGFYVTRLAYYAARGRPGYSFDDIPRG